MLEALLLTAAGICIAQASPGPNMMAVAGAALSQGRRAALLVVLGIASGSLVWAAATAAGLAALLAAVPALITVLKFAGGLYLLYIALRGAMTAARGEGSIAVAAPAGLDGIAAWRRGVFVVLTNPKAALMWSAIASFLYGSGFGSVEVLLFGPFTFVSASVIYGTYGLLFSSGFAMSAYARFARWFEAAFAAVFGTLGAILLIDGIRDLVSGRR
jgi:threonine/homoserine/homoserine lactone efflux protein